MGVIGDSTFTTLDSGIETYLVFSHLPQKRFLSSSVFENNFDSLCELGNLVFLKKKGRAR